MPRKRKVPLAEEVKLEDGDPWVVPLSIPPGEKNLHGSFQESCCGCSVRHMAVISIEKTGRRTATATVRWYRLT
jgi:hypothetical protein